MERGEGGRKMYGWMEGTKSKERRKRRMDGRGKVGTFRNCRKERKKVEGRMQAREERKKGRKKERKEGRNKGRKEGRKDGKKEGRKDGRKKGRKDRQTDGRTDGQTDRQTDRRTDRQTEGRKEGRKEGRNESENVREAGKEKKGNWKLLLTWSSCFTDLQCGMRGVKLLHTFPVLKDFDSGATRKRKIHGQHTFASTVADLKSGRDWVHVETTSNL